MITGFIHCFRGFLCPFSLSPPLEGKEDEEEKAADDPIDHKETNTTEPKAACTSTTT
jgi:hypothetical protein